MSSDGRPMRPIKRMAFNEEILPVFRDSNAQNKAAQTGKWDVACVLKLLCPKDSHIVSEIAKTNVKIYDPTCAPSHTYTGGQWTQPGDVCIQGYTIPGQPEIGISTDQSCEDVAATFVHEVRHRSPEQKKYMQQFKNAKTQDFAAEYDSFYAEEQWRIDRKLPGVLRETVNGIEVPSRKKIIQNVHDSYGFSIPPEFGGSGKPGDPPAPEVVGKTAKGNSITVDHTGKRHVRPPQEGDTYNDLPPNAQPTLKQVIPAQGAGTTPWKCPAASPAPAPARP